MTTFKKHYCCLHHYLSGKSQKGNTPCYSHVALGIINPIHQPLKRLEKQLTPNLELSTQKWTLKSHTHFYNDIKNKQSLPKRLAEPRIYVGQVYSKGKAELKQTSRVPVNKQTFDEIAEMFERFAHNSNCHTNQQLHRKVLSYMESRGISRKDQNLLVMSYQFQDFLTVSGMELQHAKQFYLIAFRQHLFTKNIKSQAHLSEQRNDLISMRAFEYNFKKFYTDCKSYKRMFSGAALKQRLIDLRVHLQPWHDNNIILKSNMQRHRIAQFEILQSLKRQDQQLYEKFLSFIEKRNSKWMHLRTLAKALYSITDGKGFGKAQLEDAISQSIQSKSYELQVFTQFAQKYLQSRESSHNQQNNFKATELIQFLRDQKMQQSQQAVIIKWIRGIFKYIFFFKQTSVSQGEVMLRVNRKTLNLDCINGILIISSRIILEFIQYKTKIIQDYVRILNSLLTRVQTALENMPQLQTHVKETVQKNYVVETVLRVAKEFQNFQDFSLLWKVVSELDENGEANISKIVQSFIRNPSEVPNDFKKILFSFQETKHMPQIKQQKIDRIALALQKYQQTKNSLPQLNRYAKGNPSLAKPKQKIATMVAAQQHQKKTQRKISKQDSDKNVKQENKTFNAGRYEQPQKRHACSSGYCKACGQIPASDINETIQSVEEMENIILNLLGL